MNDDGTDLCIEPIETLHTLEDKVWIDQKNISLADANAALNNVTDDMLYIRIVADVSNAQEFGITMLKGGKWDETKLYYDVANELINGSTENKGEGAKAKAVSGVLPNENGTITMEIYIDRSLVEGFFNDYKAISIRAYPEQKDSKAIELFAAGDVKITELYVASMSSIFD